MLLAGKAQQASTHHEVLSDGFSRCLVLRHLRCAGRPRAGVGHQLRALGPGWVREHGKQIESLVLHPHAASSYFTVHVYRTYEYCLRSLFASQAAPCVMPLNRGCLAGFMLWCHVMQQRCFCALSACTYIHEDAVAQQ